MLVGGRGGQMHVHEVVDGDADQVHLHPVHVADAHRMLRRPPSPGDPLDGELEGVVIVPVVEGDDATVQPVHRPHPAWPLLDGPTTEELGDDGVHVLGHGGRVATRGDLLTPQTRACPRSERTGGTLREVTGAPEALHVPTLKAEQGRLGGGGSVVAGGRRFRCARGLRSRYGAPPYARVRSQQPGGYRGRAGDPASAADFPTISTPRCRTLGGLSTAAR